MATKLLDKNFMYKNGVYVLMQKPNTPIIVGLLATLVSKLLAEGNLKDVSGLVGYGALFTWAWMELFDGVNYFRRLLGLGVIVFMIVSRVYK